MHKNKSQGIYLFNTFVPIFDLVSVAAGVGVVLFRVMTLIASLFGIPKFNFLFTAESQPLNGTFGASAETVEKSRNKKEKPQKPKVQHL